MKKILSILTLGALTACGGSTDVEQPVLRPEGLAAGKVQHGPIANATITAYDWDGTRGAIRGSTTSDNLGLYALNIQSENNTLLLVARGGSYSEEATSRSVQMQTDDELSAVIFYESGKTIDAQLTYFTTLSVCRATYLINNENLSAGDAINSANNEVSSLLNIDPIRVKPLDVTQNNAFTALITPEHRYGIALAGVSEMVEKLRKENNVAEDNPIYTVKYLTKVACSDLEHDGMLNGIGQPTTSNPTGQLYLGVTPLTIDHYRLGLAQGIISFADNPNNQTGLKAVEFIKLANRISTSTSIVFDRQEGSSVDNEGPVITTTFVADSLVNGVVEIPFEISDPLGVKLISFFIDDELYSDGQPENPSLSWQTTAYTDGPHTIKVVALDELDNESSKEFSYTVANIAPSITLESAKLVKTTSYKASGSFSAVAANVDRIEVNSANAVLNMEQGTWSADIELAGGVNEVEINIYDTLGNVGQISETVSVDLFDPIIDSDETLATLTNLDGQLNTCESILLNNNNSAVRPICFNTDKISLNGQPVTYALDSSEYLVLGVDFVDQQGTHGVFTDNANLILEYKVQLNDQLVVDWSLVPRPVLSKRFAHLPVTTEYFGETFYQVSLEDEFQVHFRVTDEAGGSSELIYRFSLDVITPILAVETNIDDSIFATSFSSRNVMNNADFDIEYSFTNDSLPRVIKINPSEQHLATQNYQSVLKKNLVRTLWFDKWAIKTCQASLIDCTQNINFQYWSDDYIDVPALQWLKAKSSPSDPDEYEIIFPDPEPRISSYQEVLYDVEHLSTVRLDGVFLTLGYQYPARVDCIPTWSCQVKDLINTANPNQFGRVISKNAVQGDRETTYFVEQTEITYEVKEGYPKLSYVPFNREYEFSLSEIQVIDLSNGREIFPEGDSYRIPAHSEIRIVREYKLPIIDHYLDIHTLETADYLTPKYEGVSVEYVIDTDIQIMRAIDPGNQNLDALSYTASTHGDGLVDYVVGR